MPPPTSTTDQVTAVSAAPLTTAANCVLPPAGTIAAGGWAMTYWGGALFCLLADVEIREKTGNARAHDDALPAINAVTPLGNDSRAICSTRVTASPTETFGARLNDSTTDGNCP